MTQQATYDFINQESQDMYSMQQQTENKTSQKDMKILVEKISRVTQMISQVEQQVYHQGSIMDRIDSKLEETLTGVQMGNDKLNQAK